MARPFVRLFLISVGVVSWMFLSLFGLRFLGSLQTFQPLSHKLMFQPSPPFELSPRTTEPRLTKLQLFISGDQKWMIIDTEKIGDNTDQSIAMLDSKQLETQMQAQLLTNYDLSTTESLALFIRAEHNAPLKKLYDYIQTFPHIGERVIVLTDYPGVVRELKKHSPRWLYSSTPPTLIKVELFASLLIENLADYPFDLLIVDVNEDGEPLLSKKIISEAKRRHLKIISRGLKPLSDEYSKPDHLYAHWQTAALPQ